MLNKFKLNKMKIKSISALEILDSRGNPTVEARVELEDGTVAYGAVPSGASTGTNEAVELRDGDKARYRGKGTLTAVNNVNTQIAQALVGMDASNQEAIDNAMVELDGTDNKGRLGANAILSVSIAVCKAAAYSAGIPVYQHVAQLSGNSTDSYKMPIPMMNLLNGGKHAIGSADMQEFMVMPVGAGSLTEAVRIGAEIFHALGKILHDRGFQTTVGDEGGYAPALGNNEGPLEAIMEAIEAADYEAGKEVFIAMDPASSEFYSDGMYDLATEDLKLTSTEMTQRYIEWMDKYPIISIEDGHAEDDWDGFVELTEKVGDKLQIVGDDLFVTNTRILQEGIDKGAGNSILVKVNQIGSVTESINAIKLAHDNGYTAVVSHRSGETEDAFIADFVVGTGTGQIKTGSLSRSDRISKYNQLMRIEAELGDKAIYPAFPKEI